MRLITNLPADLLLPFLSNRFQANIKLRRTENGYIMKCEPTPLYQDLLRTIQDTYVLYYRDVPILLQPLRSKL
jgi:hypothetical protein